ncbi:DNA primase, partial [Candidatus Parcubacteria bacterium]|nr:DNA primase [Candidatus Parcubacteria bacterium]
MVKSEKGFYDRFRGRIVFPVGNAQGKIVGFSGRHFLPAQAGVSVNEEGAKYINTPETPLYNKSKVIYGFDKAK